MLDVTSVEEAIKANPTTFIGNTVQEAKKNGAKEVNSSDLFYGSLIN